MKEFKNLNNLDWKGGCGKKMDGKGGIATSAALVNAVAKRIGKKAGKKAKTKEAVKPKVMESKVAEKVESNNPMSRLMDSYKNLMNKIKK